MMQFILGFLSCSLLFIIGINLKRIYYFIDWKIYSPIMFKIGIISYYYKHRKPKQKFKEWKKEYFENRL